MIKPSIIIGIMAIIIILLLINIYQQNKQIFMLQNSYTENLENVSNTGTTDTNQNKNRIVLYYANWCGFCKDLLPKWAAFEQRNSDKIIIEKVDCESSKCDVGGFPTIKLYKLNGEVVNFDGPRTLEGLENFIQ